MFSKKSLQSEQSVINLSGLQLLIVEADRDTRLLYTCLFEDYGAQVLAVASIAEALELLELQQPHLFISEICLPDKDGYRLIYKMRQLKTLQGQIPTIAVSASTDKNKSEESSLSQFLKCLTKPLSLYKLVALVAKLKEGKVFDR
jgi:two-component system, OmpR family, response regulator